jgi:hypothetical protein
LGTCPLCIGLCAVWLAQSLLVFGLSTSLALRWLTAISLAGAAIFGTLLILHGVYYILRRKSAGAPAASNSFRPLPQPRQRCCGGR